MKWYCKKCNKEVNPTEIDEIMYNLESRYEDFEEDEFIKFEEACNDEEFVFICPCCNKELMKRDFEQR